MGHTVIWTEAKVYLIWKIIFFEDQPYSLIAFLSMFPAVTDSYNDDLNLISNYISSIPHIFFEICYI